MDNKDIGCIYSNNFADIKYYSASCKTTSRRFSKRDNPGEDEKSILTGYHA